MGRFLRETKAKEAKSWPRAWEEGRKRYSSPERNNEDRNMCKQFMPGGVLELCPLTKALRFPIQLLCISDLTGPALFLINYLHLKSSIKKQKMVKYLPVCPVAITNTSALAPRKGRLRWSSEVYFHSLGPIEILKL